MPEKYSDEKYIAARSLLERRKSILTEISMISDQIEKLKKMRNDCRIAARRLKSNAIAQRLGVSTSWVEKVSEGRVTR